MIRSHSFAAAAFSAVVLMLAACAPTPLPPPAPAPIPGPQSISERTLMTMAADVAFPSGGYTLTRAGRAKLNELVPMLQTMPAGKVVVYGYTDNQPVGKALRRKGVVDNLDLSSKRANAVVRYLVSKGIDPNVVSGKGRADTHPLAPNDTKAGRAENRRIEVVAEQPTG
jgi:chemotaxis protein MotB